MKVSSVYLLSIYPKQSMVLKQESCGSFRSHLSSMALLFKSSMAVVFTLCILFFEAESYPLRRQTNANGVAAHQVRDEVYVPPAFDPIDGPKPVSTPSSCIRYNEPCKANFNNCCTTVCTSTPWEGSGQFRCLPSAPVCYRDGEQCAGARGLSYVRKWKRSG